MVDISKLPFFELCINVYRAEVKTLRGPETAALWTPRYRDVLQRGAGNNVWACFGSAKNDALRDDVLAVLDKLFDRFVAQGDSIVEGYHPVGYLWEFSERFANRIASGETDSKLFLFPGDFGSEFTGRKPEELGSHGCVTPPHLTQIIRSMGMSLIGNRGVIITPFGKGGKKEGVEHREMIQLARWSMTAFTGWPEEELPLRFLIDTQLASGWFFDMELIEVAKMRELGSLYPHDLERESEVIIRVTGERRVNTDVLPHVYEFSCAAEAAEFIVSRGK